MLVDVNGYFAPPGPGGHSFYSVPPCRIYDSRNGEGPFGVERTLNVAGNALRTAQQCRRVCLQCNSSAEGLTRIPDSLVRHRAAPVVSTLNAYDGFVTSNMAIVATDNGSIDAYATRLTQLILDISGYFAP